MFSAPEDLEQLEPTYQPMNDDGTGHSRVLFVPVKLSEISRKVMNPNVVTLTRLIESGDYVDPTKMMRVFKISDPADLEVKREQLGENMFKYLLEHKDEIKPAQAATVLESE